MDRPRGAFVDGVMDDSPAASAGIEDEDIIVEFNGHEIEYFTDLPFYVGQYQPGTEAAVRLMRNGEIQRVTVVLGSSPTNESSVAVVDTAPERANPLGFKVAELSDETRQVAGIDGVRVAQVEDGPGREAGLQEGDVVTSLNREPVTSVSEFAAIAEALPEERLCSDSHHATRSRHHAFTGTQALIGALPVPRQQATACDLCCCRAS